MASKETNYLEAVGWLHSAKNRQPVNGAGEPIPWYSYAAIHFLENRLPTDLDVWEFGSGLSTLWWATRCRSLRTVEHNRGWYEKMTSLAPDNVSLNHVELDIDGDYAASIALPAQHYDIVVVDGRDRVHCAIHAIPWIKPRGIVVWDDSERERYTPGFEALKTNGFRRIDFIGLGPVTANRQATTIFYRDGNILGL